ncbi:MAG: thioredoxin domain-containing protein [Planctomycetaceae bacterium]|nr:thioredoxin domain-containing protein [Planctomycetaceae bacterium]
MPNRLARETSPYLLQHANNPVDWFPWGQEALERAKQTGRPIFLSIGYSACHWCHVMEHESFENQDIAKLMNERFVNIKVDREERPDLDQIYMSAVQAMTGRGGWPMSVFLTPDLEPFFGGTYWPPEPKMGMAGFNQVLVAVADAWRDRKAEVVKQAGELTAHLKTVAASTRTVGDLEPAALPGAADMLERMFEPRWGGFGQAPKFPHAMDLRLLLRIAKRERRAGLLPIVTKTLDSMAAGGIYDHLGGGFHRYSVDERWLVPHFEKMLYDNALLTPAYLEAYQVTGDARYAQVARETLDYVLRDMTDPAGGFYSTLDADSEGEEGKYYVWSMAEIEQVLGADRARTFSAVYDVTIEGNFEGASILNLPRPLADNAAILKRDPQELAAELAETRAKLLAVREKRVRPGLDDKVLVSWNGLMIDALALGARVLDEPRYLQAAERGADFLLTNLVREGKLLHTWRHGEARLDAYLDDYACLANALVSVYEGGFQERYLDAAVRLVERLLTDFADAEHGGFFYTSSDHEQLITRQKDLQDGSVPSGNGMAATVLVRLGKLCGRNDLLEAAVKTMRSSGRLLSQSPISATQMLLAYDLYLGPTYELALVGKPAGDEADRVLAHLGKKFVPHRVLAARLATGDPQAQAPTRSALLEPLFAGKEGATALRLFVCENFACQAPVEGRADIEKKIDQLAAGDRAGR